MTAPIARPRIREVEPARPTRVLSPAPLRTKAEQLEASLQDLLREADEPTRTTSIQGILDSLLRVLPADDDDWCDRFCRCVDQAEAAGIVWPLPDYPSAHYTHSPCAVGCEIDAAELAQHARFAEPISLPLLGRLGYIIQGWSQIISGYPKAGKTELLFSCVREWVADGVSVLWLSEESQAVWQQRMWEYPVFPLGLRIVFAIGAEPDELLARAKNGSEHVVVVDTIRNLLQIKDENSNSQVAAALVPWEAALSGRTRIYVHHQRKMGGDHGHAIAGGGAFLGIVDRAIELQFDSHAKKRRQLVVRSRIAEAPDLLYEMTDNGLRALGEPDAVAASKVQARVLALLDGEWQTVKRTLECLDEPRPSTRQVQAALKALRAAGKVERNPADDRNGATYTWRRSP